MPEVKTSSASRASSNVTGTSSTVYPLAAASSNMERRVMPGRMVPCSQYARGDGEEPSYDIAAAYRRRLYPVTSPDHASSFNDSVHVLH